MTDRSSASPLAIRTAPRWPYLSLLRNAAQQATCRRWDGGGGGAHLAAGSSALPRNRALRLPKRSP